MRFFSLSKAKKDIKDGLSESEIFSYAFGSMLLVTLLFLLPESNHESESFEYFFWILCVVLEAFGFRECFFANGGNSGNNFLPRIACLGWVVGWRVYFPSALLYLIYFVFAIATGTEEGYQHELITWLWTMAEIIIYWLYLASQLRALRREESL